MEKPKLQVISNPEQDPEAAGAKQWANQLFRHLANPDDQEAFAFLKRQNDFDVRGRPKPMLVPSVTSSN